MIEKSPVKGQGRILLMDDEEMIRDAGAQMLSYLGYEVEFAINGTEAIELYKKAKEDSKPFDVVIMDLTVPGAMGGKEAVKQLHEKYPDAKVIVCSGYSNDPVIANFKQYGFDDVITKPFDVKELGKVLNNVVKLQPK
ncbi:MAG: response regulator [Candidatus Anammoxibacter sp.]